MRHWRLDSFVRLFWLAFVLAASISAFAFGSEPATLSSSTPSAASSSATRPDWCRAGFVCVPVDEMVLDTAYKIRLEAEAAEWRAKAKKHLDWHLGCGPGIGFVVNTGWDAKAAPVPLMCGVIYGW